MSFQSSTLAFSLYRDLGCGPGNVLCTALFACQPRAAIGIEYNADVVDIGHGILANERKAQRVDADLLDRIELCVGDLSQLTQLPADATHVFSYDRVMKQTTLQHIATLLNALRPTVFVSFQLPKDWRRWGLLAECVDKLPACSTTGGQKFTAYFFKWSDDRNRSTSER